MLNNLQMAGLLGLTALVRAAYEAENHRNGTSEPQAPSLSLEEVCRVQQFLSYPPQAQEKALAYLQNLRRYLTEED